MANKKRQILPYLYQQHRLQDKKGNERQRGAIYNDKRDTPPRGHTLVNIYPPNTGTPKYIKQLLTELKGEIDSNTIIVGDLNTPLT